MEIRGVTQNLRKYLCVSVSAMVFVSQANASTLDELNRFNRQYSLDYFALLQLKASAAVSLGEFEERLVTLRAQRELANKDYMAIFAAYQELQRQVDTAQNHKSEAQAAINQARADDEAIKVLAVRRGYFPNSDAVKDAAIKSLAEQKYQEAQVMQPGIDAVNSRLMNERTKIDYLALQTNVSAASDRLRASSRVEEGILERLQTLRSQIRASQDQIETQTQTLSTDRLRKATIESTELPAVNRRVARFELELAERNRSFSEVERLLNEKTPRVQEMYDRLSRLNQEVHSLQTQLRSFEEENASLQERWSALSALEQEERHLEQSAIPHARRELDSAHSMLATQERELREAQNQVSIASTQYEEKRRREESIVQQRSSIAAEVARLRQELQTLKMKIADLPRMKTKRDQLASTQIPQASSALAVAQTELAQAVQASQEARIRLNQAQNELHAQMGLVHAKRGELRNAQMTLAGLQARSAQLQARMAHLKPDSPERAALLEQLQQLQNNEIPRAQSLVQTLSSEVENLEEKVSELRQAVDRERAASFAAERQLHGAERTVERARSTLAALEREKSSLDVAISQMDSVNQRATEIESASLPEASRKQQVLDARLNEASRETQVSRAVHDAAVAERNRQQRSYDEAVRAVQAASSNVENLSQRLAELKRGLRERPALRDRLAQLAAVIPETRNRLMAAERAASELDSRYRVAHGELQRMQSRRDDLLAEIQNIDAQLRREVSEQTDLASELNTLGERIEQTLSRIAELKDTLASRQSQLDVANGQLAQAQATVANDRTSMEVAREALRRYSVVHIDPIENELRQKLANQQFIKNQAAELLQMREQLMRNSDIVEKATVVIQKVAVVLESLAAKIAETQSAMGVAQQKISIFDGQITQIISQQEELKKNLLNAHEALQKSESEQDLLVKNLVKEPAPPVGVAPQSQQVTLQDLGKFADWSTARIDKHALWLAEACVATTKATRDSAVLEVFAGRDKNANLPTEKLRYLQPTVQVVVPLMATMVRGVLKDAEGTVKIHLTLASSEVALGFRGLLARLDDRSRLVELIRKANTLNLQLFDNGGAVLKTLTFSLRGSNKAITQAVSSCELPAF